jgi:Protein of unknown function (DUF429)
MKIFGLDFTSAPGPKKPITVAVCDLQDDLLRVNEIMIIESFAAFESFLQLPGPWVAALDFPFGLPQKLLANLGWPGSWKGYISLISLMNKIQFEQTLIQYREKRPSGDKHHLRTTDGFASACSPMMLTRVPVGKMFFQGAPRLLAAGVSILPCHPTPDDRIAVEGYPALIVRKLIGKRSYKCDKCDKCDKQTSDKATARRDIILGLRTPILSNQYGVTIELPDTLAESCMQDSKGDTLDALLCALQAAWAYTQRDDGYGIPSKSHSLEGWIVDPGLLTCEQSNQYSQNPN